MARKTESEFSSVADRIERRDAALTADRKHTRERNAAMRPIRKAVAERERAGRGSATPERIAKAGDQLEVMITGTQRINPTGLDAMLRHSLISQWEYEAGDEFRRTAEIAGINPGAPTVDWGALSGNFGPRPPRAFSSQNIHDAIVHHRRATEALQGSGGADLKDLLIIEKLCLDDWGPLAIGRTILNRRHKRDAVVAATECIKLSLQRLAAHYAYARLVRRPAKSAKTA